MVLLNADERTNNYCTWRRDRKLSLKSESFITKVMFLAAVAVPRYDYHWKKHFNGKIECWPIVENTTAKRSSCNRMKGSKILCPVNVTKEVYTKLLVEKLFPGISEKLLYCEGPLVEIQQDNATPHHCWNDPLVETESRLAGWKSSASIGHQTLLI